MSDAPRYTDDGRLIYEISAGTKLAEFITANNFVDVIEGPIGSGKSVGWCLRIMRHAQEQAPSTLDGLRKTRWAVVRNTFPDLKRTTIRTWIDTFPEDIYGRFTHGMSPQHKIAFADVRMEVDFLALDKPEDVRKLRSGEYTGIAFNELQYIDKELFDEATSRVGRYPKEADGGATWSGVIGDANAPDEDHWLAMMTGQVDLPPGMTEEEKAALVWPSDWGFFLQPAALIERFDEHGRLTGYEVNPLAENLKNLRSDYYSRMIQGKTKAWIDSRLMVRVVLVVDGSPVWPMFRREFHVSGEVLRPVQGHEVLVALDFGRVRPAALFMQALNNRVYVQYELRGANEGATIFAPKVKRFLAEHYPGFKFRCVGDPKGRDKGVQDERSSYDVFESFGMHVTPAPVKMNNIETRIEIVAFALNDNPRGVNRLVISPLCRSLVVGMAGRYHLVREQDGVLRPNKDFYSDICDCLQYGLASLGEGRRMIGLSPSGGMKPVKYAKPTRGLRRRVA